MDGTLDRLEIEISASGEQASKGLDKLVKTLEKLKNATSGIGLSSVASEVSSASASFASLPPEMQKIITMNEKVKASNAKIGSSFASLKKYFNFFMVMRVGKMFGGWFDKSNEYVESLNLFNVAMGESTDAAFKYAEQVQELMGINLKDWMTGQGSFQQLFEGFGIANDKAAIMSKTLTQLSYDYSSLHNKSVEMAMHRFQSGMSGQIKGLKDWGVNLSIAQLKETALKHGITLSTSKMTEAQKAYLRYITTLDQSKKVIGDMARTIDSPANSLRIFNNLWGQLQIQLGRIISVVIVPFIPYMKALVSLLLDGAKALALFLGYNIVDLNWDKVGDGVGKLDEGIGEVTDGFGEATAAAKKLKDYTLGFDELNILSPQDESSGGGGGGGGLGGGYASDFGLGTPELDSWLAGIKTKKLDELKEKLKEILVVIGEIAVGLLLWKLSSSFLGKLNALSVALGAVLLIDSIRCVLKDGLDFGDIVKGAIGGALIGAGIGFKLGGWSGALGGATIGIGVALSILGITSMFAEGINIKNVITTAIGLGLTGAAIGFMIGGWGTALGGISIGIGITFLITGIKSMMDDGINLENAVQMISGVLFTAGGIYTAVKLFNSTTKSPIPEMETSTKTIEDIGKGTSKLTIKLKDLVKNLGLGIVIIAEVAVAATIIVGSIWLLGVMLEKVGTAWQPVIDNGDTILIAMGLGTGILLGVGIATALLGSIGTTLIVNLGLGITVLALIGAAAILFLAEIWLIGKGLDEIGKAWQPVIKKKDTIATAIGLGSAILLGIGVVCFALGALAISSGGTVPVAIAAGTGMLVLLGVDAILFIKEVKLIGKELAKIPTAWKPVLENGKTIESAIEKASGLLLAIGVVCAALGVLAIASVGLLPLAIAAGTGMLILLTEAFIEFITSVKKIAVEVKSLLPKLQEVNPYLPLIKMEQETFNTEMAAFAGLIWDFSKNQAASGFAGFVSSVIGFFSGDPINKLANNVKKNSDSIQKLHDNLVIANSIIKTTIELQKDNNKFMKELSDLQSGVESNTFAASVVDIGENISLGIAKGAKNAVEAIKIVARKMVYALKEELDINSPSRVMETQVGAFVGEGVVVGALNAITDGVPSLVEPFKDVANEIQNQFNGITFDPKINYAEKMKELGAWSSTVNLNNLEEIARLEQIRNAKIKGMGLNSSTTDLFGKGGMYEGMLTQDQLKEATKQNITEPLANILTKTEETTIDVINAINNGILDISVNLKQLNELINTGTVEFSQGVTLVVDLLKSSFENFYKTFEDSIKVLINEVRNIGFALNYFQHSVERNNHNVNNAYKSGSSVSIPKFSQGGYPKQGQLFIAREAGAEMVGGMGGHTTVANNDQIVEGISYGVEQANAKQNALLSEQNSLLRALLEKDTSIKIGDDIIGRSNSRYENNRGVKVSGGVFANAY